MGSINSRMAITSWPHRHICPTLLANLYVRLPFWQYEYLPELNVLSVIVITFCQRSAEMSCTGYRGQSTVLWFIDNRQQAGFVVDCWSCCAFLSYGLLTSPEWVCTMGGCVIYNLHACSTFTKVGGPGGWVVHLWEAVICWWSWMLKWGSRIWRGPGPRVQPWGGSYVHILPFLTSAPASSPIRLCLFISRSTHLISSDSNELSFPLTILCK